MSLSCPFEKAILSGQCQCAQAARAALGEHLGVGCRSAPAQLNCTALLAQLRDRARFALKVTHAEEPLPFGKELKLALGGLWGLKRALNPQATDDRVDDIHGLVAAAQAAYGRLDKLPYEDIVKSIAAQQLRRRRRPPSS